MSVVPLTAEMRRARAYVAVNIRFGRTEEVARWRREYARLEAAELRRLADELDKKYDTA